MRIYKTDGTFIETQDTEFGWNLDDIAAQQNRSQDRVVYVKKQATGSGDEQVHSKIISKPHQLLKEEAFLESVDIIEPEKPPVAVKHVKVNVKTEPIVNVINCKMDIEGPPVNKDESKLTKDLENVHFTIASKEELSKLINPCNIETRALMSVIYFAKYKSLIKEETSAELFKTVNFKTTNFKCLIKDRKDNIAQEIMKDIQHYHATKEDNMLSLMMELILADIGCNLEDIIDVNEQSSGVCDSENTLETSGFGNGSQSSFLSSQKNSYLNVSDRSSILSSIGLDEQDRSLQNFCEETLEMRLQTAEIRESFQKEESKVNQLIKITTALKDELKEALYLDDILHLLKGDLEKVKLKKLPFKVFYKEQNTNLELNLII